MKHCQEKLKFSPGPSPLGVAPVPESAPPAKRDHSTDWSLRIEDLQLVYDALEISEAENPDDHFRGDEYVDTFLLGFI